MGAICAGRRVQRVQVRPVRVVQDAAGVEGDRVAAIAEQSARPDQRRLPGQVVEAVQVMGGRVIGEEGVVRSAKRQVADVLTDSGRSDLVAGRPGENEHGRRIARAHGRAIQVSRHRVCRECTELVVARRPNEKRRARSLDHLIEVAAAP